MTPWMMIKRLAAMLAVLFVFVFVPVSLLSYAIVHFYPDNDFIHLLGLAVSLVWAYFIGQWL